MTLQERLKEFYELFLSLSCPVYHYTRANSKETRYVVWAEEGEENSLHADDHKAEQQLVGVVDFYTLTEFDTIADDIQTIFNSVDVGWTLESVQYEEETNLIHYGWRWRLG